ncbi:MAG: hypothetical protein GOVbin1923_38 [Prokaryotic dsDNA virus sp.]|nr:MAG: hypothetical protein GOVbin1923_38 [Prokaryotic dsDNA virus sp.]|tara:strand:- start:14287 stop:14799 length:513 start_codon:yes stop_codon:yes gene_type:complete
MFKEKKTSPVFHPKGKKSTDNTVIDECTEVPSIVGKEVKTKKGNAWRFVAMKGARNALTVSQMVENYEPAAWSYIIKFAHEHSTGETICLPPEKEETPFPESSEARAVYMLARLEESGKEQVRASYVDPMTGETVNGFYRGSTPTGRAMVVPHHRTATPTVLEYSDIVSC